MFLASGESEGAVGAKALKGEEAVTALVNVMVVEVRVAGLG